jgi:hypothetical protein
VSYLESAKGIYCDELRVRAEANRHLLPESEIQVLLKEVKPNKKGLRKAQSVLKWLGY